MDERFGWTDSEGNPVRVEYGNWSRTVYKRREPLWCRAVYAVVRRANRFLLTHGRSR